MCQNLRTRKNVTCSLNDLKTKTKKFPSKRILFNWSRKNSVEVYITGNAYSLREYSLSFENILSYTWYETMLHTRFDLKSNNRNDDGQITSWKAFPGSEFESTCQSVIKNQNSREICCHLQRKTCFGSREISERVWKKWLSDSWNGYVRITY